MMKKKQIVRFGMPETNSSSSHSISISMEGPLINFKKELKIKNNKLVVPIRPYKLFSFDSELFKTNKCLDKLQYACGLYCNDIDTVSGQKRIVRFKNILKSFLGVDDVIFEWDQEYFTIVKTGNLDEDTERRVPTVDHQSLDLVEDVFENKSTLINFIFNPKSWLYGGPDDPTRPKKFYQDTQICFGDSIEDSYAIASIYFPKPIGRYDIVINHPNELIEGEDFFSNKGLDNLLNYIIWDKNTDSMVLETVSWIRKQNISKEEAESQFHPLKGGILYIEKDDKQYLVFTPGYSEQLDRVKLKKYDELKKRLNIKPPLIQITSELIPLELKDIKNNLDILQEGVDYKLFPIDVKINEFEYDGKSIYK